MAYTKTVWTNNVTPLNAANLNHMEQGIEDAHNELAAADAAIKSVTDLTKEVNNLKETVNGKTIQTTFDSSTGTLKFTAT